MVGANAVLTSINQPGAPDRYGDVAAQGAAMWTGRAPGYLKRARQNLRSGDGDQVTAKTDEFVILNSTGAPIIEAAGPDWTSTTVTIEDQRMIARITKTYRVLAMENRAAGLAVDSVRLLLQET